ncbi:MAG: radical SAM protein [Bradyrhizobium sp.]|uniref:radical SAM protein n=1 Tax=Bradyrhizobium sp. TaxID=376 RepID=UPI001D50BDE1|nr:radical SAM protein [Bradyrhizobium sp.]MBV9565019.1 radical SAM protein [Bradyrhizobium sp.]
MRSAESSETDASWLPSTSHPGQSEPELLSGGLSLPLFKNVPPERCSPDEQRNIIPGRGDLRISLTAKCNLACNYCHNEGQKAPWLHGRKTVVTLQTIDELLDLAARYGVRSVKFSGGDPGMFPDIVGVLKVVGSWRERYPGIVKWGIATNGVPFLNRRKFEALVTSDLDNISIGIDSVEPGERSKPSSPTGIPSKRLVDEFVLPLLARWSDRAIKFDIVFTGELHQTLNVIRAARELGINASVIEVNGVMERAHLVRAQFLELIRLAAEEFRLEPRLHEPLNEIYLFDERGHTPIKFYQDHCRDHDCGHCRMIHLRVSPAADGWAAVPCFLQAQARTIPLAVNGKLNTSRFEDAIEHNGCGPQWPSGTS